MWQELSMRAVALTTLSALSTVAFAGPPFLIAKTSEDPQAQATEKAGDAAAKRLIP